MDPTPQRTVPVRVSPVAHQVLVMIAAELMKTARTRVTLTMALDVLLLDCKPDLVQQAFEELDTNPGGEDEGEE